MATNTYNIPINGNWSATYPLTLTASVTSDTQGNTRKVSASLSIRANGEGFSDYNNAWEGNLQGYISIDGKDSSRVQIQTIPTSGASVSLGSYSAYVTAGRTITVKGWFYSAYSESFMPKQGWSSVSINLNIEPLKSTIISAVDFTIEDSLSLTINKFNPDFTDTLLIKIGEDVIKSINSYTSNESILFSPNELLSIYELIGNNKKSETFTFILNTRSTDSLIGTSSASATGTIKGTIKINIDGKWERGVPWVNINGSWKRGVAQVNSSGTWKRGL